MYGLNKVVFKDAVIWNNLQNHFKEERKNFSLILSYLFIYLHICQYENSVNIKNHPANIRPDEDVLKTSFVFFFRRRLQDVFKTSSSRRIYSPYSYVFRRRLQDVFKTSWSRPIYSSWSYVFTTSSRHLHDGFRTSSRRLQDVLKTSSRRLQDVSSS